MNFPYREGTAPTPNKRHHGHVVEVPVNPAVRSFVKKYPCSACGTQYSSGRIQKGTKHRGCDASPHGRFGMPTLTEKPPEKAG